MMTPHTFHVPVCIRSLVNTIKIKAKYKLRTATMLLFYSLRNKTLTTVYVIRRLTTAQNLRTLFKCF